MAITINTNVASLMAQKNLNINQDKLTQTLTRLSSGLKINHAKDDAAGLAIAEGLTSQIRGFRTGINNGNNGLSLIETAEGSMNQVLGTLQRMRELAVQASNGSNQASDIAKLDSEFQSLKNEIDRVASSANFNGISVLAASTVSIQVGTENTAHDRLSISLVAGDTTTLAINAASLTTAANAQSALDSLKTAISTMTTGLAGLGASYSNIESAVAGNVSLVNNLEEAKSRIVNADISEESANLSKYQILQQAGVAMLAQANSSYQSVLKLLS